MIKPVFGIKNILIFICMFSISCLLMACVVAVYLGFFVALSEPTVDWSFLLAFFLLPLGCVFFLYLTVPLTIEQVIPRYFTCMKAVRRYISFRELKELLENEEFEPIDFPEKVYAEVSKSTLSKRLLVSQNWVYARGVYIPKKIIARVCVDKKFSYTSKASVYYTAFTTYDDRNIRFLDASEKVIIYLNKGKEIPTLKSTEEKEEAQVQSFYEGLYYATNKRDFFLRFLTS